MFTVDAILTTDASGVELTAEEFQAASAEHPPLFDLWVRNVGEDTIYFYGGYTSPLSQFVAEDPEQSRQLIVFPTGLNSQLPVIPPTPTGEVWVADHRLFYYETRLQTRLRPGESFSREYAILVEEPTDSGYPPVHRHG